MANAARRRWCIIRLRHDRAVSGPPRISDRVAAMPTKPARREPELHDMNPTTRFSDRAADYVRYRPDYPAAAIDALLEGVATPITSADVGAGTGISARLLADRGVPVIAIEPNPEMRSAAGADSRIEWRDGTAEATGLPDSSVDLVLSAQ